MAVKTVPVMVLFATVVGCGDDDCCEHPRDAALPYVEVAAIRYFESPLVDLLFVIDDSIGGIEMQAGLKTALPPFLAELGASASGLPSLHIGVVSTDMGTWTGGGEPPAPDIGSGPGSCSGYGKGGELQTNGVDLMGDEFIKATVSTGGTRTNNFSDTLANTLGTMVSLGGSGCGFEQPLKAIQHALSWAGTPGFRRGGANLAVVIVTDEDDCSVAHPTFFGPEDGNLGPLSSFRCTRHGVQCDVGGTTPDEMTQPGVKDGCHANETSSFIESVKRIADYVASSPLDPSTLLVSVIATRPSPVSVELVAPPGGGTASAALAPTCTYVGGGAHAGVRLDQFAASFRRNVRADICTNDFVTPMVQTARVIRTMTGDRCIGRAIPEGADCIAVATRLDIETPLEAWRFVADPDHCTAEGNLALEVELGAPPPTDMVVSVRCRL